MSLTLSVPDNFTMFPYPTPYTIQLDLMRHIYKAIECRKIGIVESPTGTGKTLSLLCSSLTWLLDDNDRTRKGQLDELHDTLLRDDDPDWVREQTIKRLKDDIVREDEQLKQRLKDAREKERNLRSRKEKARVMKQPRLHPQESEHDDDDDLLPENNESSRSFVEEAIERATRRNIHSDEADSLQRNKVKIFFASRTHSQLSQVLSELMRLDMKCSVVSYDDPEDKYKERLSTIDTHRRTVSLASRKHLCINEKLRAKRTDLDEACRELRNGGPDNGCPYLPPPSKSTQMDDMRDAILAIPKDIEELVSTGDALKACPYYASRSAVLSAELILLPYNLLLSQESRSALEIDLKNQVIIIDEAHNLIENLLQLHAVELKMKSLQNSLQAAEAYLQRFRTRLNALHSLHLQRFISFLYAVDSFSKSYGSQDRHATTGTTRSKSVEPVVITVSSLMSELGKSVDGVNLLELKAYLKQSKLARKIGSYSKQQSAVQTDNPSSLSDNDSITNSMYAIESLLSALMNDKEDGRVLLFPDEKNGNVKCIKYQHLNPSTYFSEMVESARCIILAGGTMSPIDDMAAQLFPGVDRERLSVFSCGHVIPSSNLQCLVVSRGPKGKELQLKFGQRNNEETLDEIGQILANLVAIVPHGLVVFFPSYSFLEAAKLYWTKTSLLTRLEKKKGVFYEPQSSSDVENVLRNFSAMADTPKEKGGALLMAVVGAKLSEGLNFSNNLARAVVIIGLPYPNLASTELKERMKYVTYMGKQRPGEESSSKNAGNELYENLCMRAVNQSIGRAIRHRDDWASLILIDSRYASQRVRSKLPRWIDRSTVITNSFGQTVKELSTFFRGKKR